MKDKHQKYIDVIVNKVMLGEGITSAEVLNLCNRIIILEQEKALLEEHNENYAARIRELHSAMAGALNILSTGEKSK